MKLSRNRKAHRFFKATQGLFGRNVVLVGGLALPYIIMTAVNLKNAVALSVAMLFSVVLGITCGLLTVKLPVWGRYALVTAAAFVGVALSRPVVQYLSSEIFDSLGIYLPMMAVNSIVLVCGVEVARTAGPARSFAVGGLAALGFALAAVLVGLLREMLTSGTVWGITVAPAIFPAGSALFFGFILLGFLCAAVQAGHRAITFFNFRADNPTAEELLRQQEERMVD